MNLGKPAVIPPLDPDFVPASLWIRDFKSLVDQSGEGIPFRIALQQPNGSTVVQSGKLLSETHPQSELNHLHVERLLKFMLWAGGGSRWFWDGPQEVGQFLDKRFASHPCGKFDSDFMAKVYGEPLAANRGSEIPEPSGLASPLGRNIEGCRIGFDLGGSDRKVAAVINGEVTFSEETPWHPYHQTDPEYHRAGIMDSIEKAKAHLPELDAIGGSSAGVFVDDRPRVASLFRGISDSDFTEKISPMFIDIGKELKVPLSIINDGEVTALAASMSLKQNAVLGIAMGTSEATGYVDAQGRVTSWLNELAFAPVDYSPKAPGRRMERGLRLRGSILFSASGRPIDSKGRVGNRSRARLARKTRARSGIHGGRMRTSQVNLPDDRNLPRLRCRSLCLFLYSLPCLDPRAVTSEKAERSFWRKPKSPSAKNSPT